LRFKSRKPPLKPFADHRHQLFVVKGKLFPEPGIPCDKGALSRLLGSTDKVRRKELCQCGGKLCIGVRLAVWRHEEAPLVLLAGVAAEQIAAIVQQKPPFTLIRQSSLAGLLK